MTNTVRRTRILTWAEACGVGTPHTTETRLRRYTVAIRQTRIIVAVSVINVRCRWPEERKIWCIRGSALQRRRSESYTLFFWVAAAAYSL